MPQGKNDRNKEKVSFRKRKPERALGHQKKEKKARKCSRASILK
jgi:hypothetical protein